jgi:hypothetical protein
MTLTARLASGIVVILLVIVGALTGLTLHSRTQRNDALAVVARLQTTVQEDSLRSATLEQQVQSLQGRVDSLQGQVDSLSNDVNSLNGQVEWDKSHLLDCWVLIQRLAPAGLLSHDLATYPVSSEHTARSTPTLVSRCASDALP